MKLQKRLVIEKQESSFKDKLFFWKGVPVCLTLQLAEFYECKDGNIIDNFNNNKLRFKIKKHYFV